MLALPPSLKSIVKFFTISAAGISHLRDAVVPETKKNDKFVMSNTKIPIMHRTQSPPCCHRVPGMTLLELTVVILVLLSLISILFIGARAWKKGSDRAGCVINIRNAQQALRAHQNVNAFPDGVAINLLTDIMGANGYIRTPTCPSGGGYEYLTEIPSTGTLVMWCSLAGTDSHVPSDYSDW